MLASGDLARDSAVRITSLVPQHLTPFASRLSQQLHDSPYRDEGPQQNRSIPSSQSHHHRRAGNTPASAHVPSTARSAWAHHESPPEPSRSASPSPPPPPPPPPAPGWLRAGGPSGPAAPPPRPLAAPA